MAEADVLLRVTGDPSGAESALDRLTARLRVFSRQRARATADVETARGDSALDGLQRSLAAFAVTTATAKGKLDTSAADTSLAGLRARLASLSTTTATPDVQLRAAGALAQITALQARLAALDAKKVTIDVDVRRGVVEQIAAISASVSRLGPAMGGTAGRTGALSRALGGLGIAAGGAGGAASGAARGVSSVGGAAGPAVAAVAGLVGVIGSSLVAALASMGASAGAAVGGLAALGAAFGATVVPGVILAIGALSRLTKVMGALKAQDNAVKAARESQIDGAAQRVAAANQETSAIEAVQDAERGLIAARRAVSRARQQAAQQEQAAMRALQDAERGLASAREQAAQRINAANQAQAAATRTLRSAQDDLKRSAQDAYRAIADAAEAATDAVLGLSDAQLGMDSAKLSVREAEQALVEFRKTATGPMDVSGQLQLERLTLAVKEAKLREAQATDRLGDSQRELTDAQKQHNTYQKEGLSAFAPYTAAIQSVRDAKRELTAATRESNALERDGIAGAEEVVSARRGVADAERALAQARQGGADAVQGALEGVLDAERRLGQAQRARAQASMAATAGVSSQAAAAKAALEGLTGAELALLGVLKKVRGELAGALRPATDAVFRGMADGLSRVGPLARALSDEFLQLGRAVGGMFRTLGAELTDAPWTAAMEKFTASAARMTASTTSIFTGLLRIMREVALAALPHLEAGFAKLAAKLERITTPEGLRKIGPVVDKLIGHFKSWMDLMGSLGGVMVALGVAIAPLGKGLVESLAAAADKTAAWIRTAEGTAKVKQVFTDLSSLAGSVAKAIGTIIVGFVDLSATAAPAVKALGDHLARLGGALGTALGPVFKQLIATIKRFFDSLAPAVPFLENILLPIFVGVFKGILAALQPVITVIGFFAKVLGWIGTAAEPLKPIFEGLGTVIGFLFGGPILGAVGGILKGIGFGFGLLGKAVSLAGKVLSWIGGLVGKLLSGPLAGLKAIGGVIGGGFKALGGVAKGAWGGIKNEVGRSAQGAKNIAVGAFNGLKDKATSGWNRLKVSAEKLWNSGIGQTIRGAASKAKDGAGQAFTILKDRAVKDFGKVKDGAARIFGGLKDFIVNKVKAAGEGIGRLASGFFNVGVEIIKGLIRGVGRMAQAVINKVKNIVTGAKNAAKRLLGIGSPSKVFAGFGQAVGQGFIDGVEGMARPIARAVEDTMGARVQAAGTDLAASLTSGGAVVGARGLAAPAAAGGAPVTVERHYHIQTIGGAAAPDPDFLIAQLDKRISDEGV